MLETLKANSFEAKDLYRIGAISRSEAKERILPYIEVFNAKSKEIAKKYGMRGKTISFAGFVR